MKKQIKITTNEVEIKRESITKEIDFPEKECYFCWMDDGCFFPRGLVLFSIVPNYKGMKNPNYTIMQIERGQQVCNDFVPSKDCRGGYWLKETIRKTALDIITGENKEFKPMDKELFFSERQILLDHYIKE